MERRKFLQSASMAGVWALGPRISGAIEPVDAPKGSQTVKIQTEAVHGKLPHTWEGCVGSDRANVGLRAQWLSDLKRVKEEIGFKSVRFHGLLNDEMGVLPPGASKPNFLYVDMVFDAMLELGVKPFVELSFMPAGLASGSRTIFFYRGNTTPPKEMARWGELVGALGKHCVDRYGIQEVSTWNFEVWNEPNIVFWAGTKPEYFEMYRQSAIALKGVDKRLRVGGPSTAQAAWVGDLMEYCSSQNVPIDFASTHIYASDPQNKVFGEGAHYPFEEVIPRALVKIQEEIKASKMPDTPLYITEWTSQNPAFIAHTVKSTIGLADIMSYWTFDNVFEELGIPKTFLNSAFGLLGMRGIPRPSYHAFALLHKLGDVQLKADDGPVLATRRADGSLAIMVWNLIPRAPGLRVSQGDPLVQTDAQDTHEGNPITVNLQLQGHLKHWKARITHLDDKSGNMQKAYQQMGCPQYPTMEQIAELKRKSELEAPETKRLDAQGQISISIPPNGIALLELI